MAENKRGWISRKEKKTGRRGDGWGVSRKREIDIEIKAR